MIEQDNPAPGLPLSLDEGEQELSELAANLQSIAESEKVLLARQLHDELGGALVGKCRGRSDQVTDPRNPRLYLDVSGHGVTVATWNGRGKRRGGGVSGDCVTV